MDHDLDAVGFDDLECPYCAKMHQQLFPALTQRYKDQIHIVYRDFPLDQHPWAMRAAIAETVNGLSYVLRFGEVAPGDLIRVPSGTWHWFDLCADRRIRAIRLFQDKSGWTPHYTESGVDSKFQPLCFGPTYIPAHRTL